MSKALDGDQDPRVIPEQSGRALESVTCRDDLVKLLVEQFARADVSLRELQARADRAGGTRLPRATCGDMLAGRRFPKKAVMMAFLRACQVPDQQLPAWERAWERVRLHQMPAGTGGDHRVESSNGTPPAARAVTEPGGPGTAPTAHGVHRRWRRAALFAAVAVPVTVAALIVVLGQRATPHHETAEAVPDHAEPVPGRVVDPAQIVSDDGRGFPRGGSSRFTVTVDPANTGVRLIRRLDVGVGLQQATITVNGTRAATWRPLIEDHVYKWRNQIVTLPPKLTSGRRSLTIVNTCVSFSGFNEFRYTVQHKVNGAWATADTVDIGRGHTASEAAHEYRVDGEDWAGTQTFAYPPRREKWNVR